MPHPISIGDHYFQSKKEAISFYREILNRYSIGEELVQGDKKSVLKLLLTHPNAKSKMGVGLKSIAIGKTRYSRCFELRRKDGTVSCFSYIQRINGPPSTSMKFTISCRQCIEEDLKRVKHEYFKKYSKGGKAKCQESNKLYKWEDLCVDHRQPNTFSMIVDRYIEVHSINIDSIEYEHIDRAPDQFKDSDLRNSFRDYHRDKANLRIVYKHLNLSRAHQGIITRQKKDLSIQQTTCC